MSFEKKTLLHTVCRALSLCALLTIYTKQNSDEHMLAADWPRLSCRVDGVGQGEEGRAGDRHALLTSLSLSPILSDDILL